MPTISMFYGIIISLYYFDNKQHHTPHIHAHYQNQEAVFDISDAEIVEGDLPKKNQTCSGMDRVA